MQHQIRIFPPSLSLLYDVNFKHTWIHALLYCMCGRLYFIISIHVKKITMKKIWLLLLCVLGFVAGCCWEWHCVIGCTYCTYSIGRLTFARIMQCFYRQFKKIPVAEITVDVLQMWCKWMKGILELEHDECMAGSPARVVFFS